MARHQVKIKSNKQKVVTVVFSQTRKRITSISCCNIKLFPHTHTHTPCDCRPPMAKPSYEWWPTQNYKLNCLKIHFVIVKKLCIPMYLCGCVSLSAVPSEARRGSLWCSSKIPACVLTTPVLSTRAGHALKHWDISFGNLMAVFIDDCLRCHAAMSRSWECLRDVGGWRGGSAEAELA